MNTTVPRGCLRQMDIRTMELLFIGAVIFVSSFLQGMFGFAFVLTGMPLLLLFLNIKFVAPLIALFLPLITGILIFQFRTGFIYRKIVPLIAGSLFGVPLGIYILDEFSDKLMKSILGLIIITYSIYSLLIKKVTWKLPDWTAYLFGLAAGILGGVYNTTGPPAVLYVSNRDWSKMEIIASLNFFIFTTSILVLLFHLISGNITSEIAVTFLKLTPVMILGMLTGIYSTRKLSEIRYRKALYVLLIVMGVMLIL